MNISKTKDTLTISNWDNESPVLKFIYLIIFSILMLFLLEVIAVIIIFFVFLILTLIKQLISSLFNYSELSINFKNKTLISKKTIAGITIKTLKHNNIKLDKLIFNEYSRNGGGFKKYVLMYINNGMSTIVYRVNHKRDKELITKEIKAHMKN